MAKLSPPAAAESPAPQAADERAGAGIARSPALVAAIPGLAALIAYVATLHPAVPGGDSGELITVAHGLGVAHPPGYPLYTLIGHVWIRLLPFGSVAWRMNLLSAVFAALAVSVVAWAVLRLTRSRGAAIVSGLLLAFAAPFWKYAIVAEVFSLNALMAAGLIAALVALLGQAGLLDPRPARAPRPARKAAAAARRGRDHARGREKEVAATSGAPEHAHESGRGTRPRALGPALAIAFLSTALVGHHHTLILLALPVALVAGLIAAAPEMRWRELHAGFRRPVLGPRGGLLVIAAGIVGLLPLIHLPLAAGRVDAMVWGEPGSPAGLLRILLRGDYGTFRLDPTAAGHVADRSHVAVFLESLPRDLGILGLLAALVGLAVLAMGRHPLLLALIPFALLQGFFFTRVGFPTVPLVFRGVVERFYILPLVVLAVTAGAGIAWLLARLPGRARAAGAGALAVVVVGLAVGLHGSQVSARDNRYVSDVAHSVLASVPANGVLFVQGDLFHNSLNYLTQVEGVRSDVVVVDQELLTYAWYPQRIRRRHPDLLPTLGPEDRYTGTAETGSLRWLDHLAGRRAATFIGYRDSSFAARWDLVSHGLVLLAMPSGQRPTPHAQVETTLAVIARTRLDGWFRDYDPWSFEADERWRLGELAWRGAFQLCHPDAFPIDPDTNPGFARLLAFLDRYRDWPGPREPELTRASGMLFNFHPAVRDVDRSRVDLTRYLELQARGPAADQVREVLVSIEP